MIIVSKTMTKGNDMSLIIGNPPYILASRPLQWTGIASVTFNNESMTMSAVLKSLKDYLSVCSSDFQCWYSDFISKAEVVDGYDGLGIGVRYVLATPDRDMPNETSTLKLCGSELNAEEIFILSNYVLTNTNIEHNEDPRIDFVESF